MVTIVSRTGVSLSASATLNGFHPATLARPFKVAGMGDYAAREEGRQRRQERRQRLADKRAYLDRA